MTWLIAKPHDGCTDMRGCIFGPWLAPLDDEVWPATRLARLFILCEPAKLGHVYAISYMQGMATL